MNLVEMGMAIRAARKSAQRSQADLARTLGMSRATISGIENGTVVEIGVRKLMSLCAAIGLEMSVAVKHGRPTLQELRQAHRAEKLRS